MFLNLRKTTCMFENQNKSGTGYRVNQRALTCTANPPFGWFDFHILGQGKLNSVSIGHQVEMSCNMTCLPEPREAEIPRSQELQGQIGPPPSVPKFNFRVGFWGALTH